MNISYMLFLFAGLLMSCESSNDTTVNYSSQSSSYSNTFSTPTSSLLTSSHFTSSHSTSSHFIPSRLASSCSISDSTITRSIDAPEKSSTLSPVPDVSTKTASVEVTPSPRSHCSGVLKDFCMHGGLCVNETTSLNKPACVCQASYYGNRCQHKASQLPPNLYVQLTYGLGGLSIFLLLVVICLLCCRRKKKPYSKSNDSLNYSQELEDFVISNKRASVVTQPKRYILNAYDMYSS